MSDNQYQPPKVWEWKQNNGGAFANINRPVSGATHEKVLPVGNHPLQLYSLGTPNGQKVTIMLEELLALGVAGWMRYVSGVDDAGQAIDVRDPLVDKIKQLVGASQQEERVSALLSLEEIFGKDLPGNPQFVADVTAAWHQLVKSGAREAVAKALRS